MPNWDQGHDAPMTECTVPGCNCRSTDRRAPLIPDLEKPARHDEGEGLARQLKEFAKATCQDEVAENGERLTYQDSIIWKAAAALESAAARNKELVEGLTGLLPWLEAAETKCLVGDEGCIWAIEQVRSLTE